jgi:hypothetical protein
MMRDVGARIEIRTVGGWREVDPARFRLTRSIDDVPRLEDTAGHEVRQRWRVWQDGQLVATSAAGELESARSRMGA